jgi:hypothetical protein
LTPRIRYSRYSVINATQYAQGQILMASWASPASSDNLVSKDSEQAQHGCAAATKEDQ